MADYNWIPSVLKDKDVKRVLIGSIIIALLVFVISYISFEVRASNGQSARWLFGMEYNIPNCDTFGGYNATHNENNTQINQPNAPIHIGNNNN